MKTLGFIGAGNMATAIIKGLFGAGFKDNIIVFDIDSEKANALSKYNACQKSNVAEVVFEADYILLAVKPQSFTDVLAEVKPAFTSDKVIISIAAGITPSYIERTLETNVKVVQVMPNTPLLLGFGATAVSRNGAVSDDEFGYAKGIFDCAGISAVVPNDKMNEIIAINGSSPAFIYQYAKHFIAYGISVGLDEDVCLKLFAQSLIGSAKMMTESGYSLDELIKMVSSKGGTTIAGLEGLEENGLDKAVNSACERCTGRAYELSK